jgi:antitoxin StbD
MTRLLTTEIATMTEMRDPQKVLDRARGRPVAVLKNSKLVGYFVPAEAVAKDGEHRVATVEEVLESLRRRRDVNQPVLDYLRDK